MYLSYFLNSTIHTTGSCVVPNQGSIGQDLSVAGLAAGVAPYLALEFIKGVSDFVSNAVEGYFSPPDVTPVLTTSANQVSVELERNGRSSGEGSLTLAEQMNCIAQGLVPAEEIWNDRFKELRDLFIKIANPTKALTADVFSKIYLTGSLPEGFKANEGVRQVLESIKKHTGMVISFEKPPRDQWKEGSVTIQIKRDIKGGNYNGPVAIAEQKSYELDRPQITLFIDPDPLTTIYVLLHELMHFFLNFPGIKKDPSHTNEIIFSGKILGLTQQMDPGLQVFSEGGGPAFGYGKNIYQVNELRSLLMASIPNKPSLENGLPPFERALLEIAFQPQHNKSNSSVGKSNSSFWDFNSLCVLPDSTTSTQSTTSTASKITKKRPAPRTTYSPVEIENEPIKNKEYLILGLIIGALGVLAFFICIYSAHQSSKKAAVRNNIDFAQAI